MLSKPRTYFLFIIVLSQFAGTSLWFAGNAVISEIQKESGAVSAANLTSFVQFGFITGTLIFAVLTVADRFKPSLLFFLSSCAAAVANASIVFVAKDLAWISALRFATGFFLAGIYPVGMKIAADWFPQKLGNALGFLVGALVLGTAFPHLLKSQLNLVSWRKLMLFTSLLAFAGGFLLYLTVPSKPLVTKNKFEPKAFLLLFRSKNFRSAAFGYFGHMWELYTFWTFLPLILHLYNKNGHDVNSSLWSFLVIAAGCAGCIIGGIISKRMGSKRVAFISMVTSFFCCVAAPLSFALVQPLFLFFLFIWGTTVVSDSPQFSTLVAQSTIQQYKGTALTIVTSIGFFITIVSIQLLNSLINYGEKSLWILAPGPFFGLLALARWKNKTLP